MGPQSVRQLRDLYGVSEATVKKALQKADLRFAPQGKTLVVPESRTGWKVEPTSEVRVLARSTIPRITAMSHEVMRYVSKARACSNQDGTMTRSLEDFKVALDTILASLDS
jgi:hypothetical protein